MPQLTKARLVANITLEAGGSLTRANAGKFVDIVFDEMQRSIVADGRFSWPAFGTLTIRRRKAKRGRNPRTKEAMIVPASVTIGFRPATGLKKAVEAAVPNPA